MLFDMLFNRRRRGKNGILLTVSLWVAFLVILALFA